MQSKLVNCPYCSARLRVDNPKNETEKRITCPNCKQKTFVRFKKEEEPVEAHTVYVTPKRQRPSFDDGATRLEDSFDSAETRLSDGPLSEETILSSPKKKEKTAILMFDGKQFPLREGRNVIGRSGKTSSATIQIPTSDRYMSRQHCCIDVKTLNNGEKKIVISNYQNKNVTKINGQQLETGDAIHLSDGDTITMGATTVTFLFKE